LAIYSVIYNKRAWTATWNRSEHKKICLPPYTTY